MIGNELNLTGTLYEVTNTESSFAGTQRSVPVQDEQFILIRDCVAGISSAQKRLYEKHSPLLYGIIKRYLYHDDGAAGEF